MKKSEKRQSLRAKVLIAMGLCLVVFMAVNLAVYLGTMPGLIEEAERGYLNKWVETVDGHLRSAELNTYRMAEDISIWDEAVAFAQGENPDFVQKSWPDNSPLDAYGFDFLIIKDAQGNDLYVEFYDPARGRDAPIPSGFTGALRPYAEQVMGLYEDGPVQSGDVHDYGKGGIFSHDGQYYVLAIMPIMYSRDAGDPVGTVTIGNVLSDSYFQKITYSDSTHVEILSGPADTESIGSRDVVIAESIYFNDMDGDPILFRLLEGRLVYRAGERTIWLTLIVNIATILIFGAVLYVVSTRIIIKPIERLTKDISNLSGESILNASDYAAGSELVTLSNSINEMLGRLNESSNYLSVLQSILRGINANIYVTDPDTDELLFINDRMLEEFGLPKDSIGQSCWKILQAGMTERCEFCPIRKLKEDPEAIIVWDEHEPITKRIYQNTDCLIEWYGHKRAHLQYNIDVTEERKAEAGIKRRMEQQELMSRISQNFVAEADLSTVIYEALRMTGEFLDVSKIVIPAILEDRGSTSFRYGWNNEKQGVPPIVHTKDMPLNKQNSFYVSFIEKNLPYITCEDVSKDEGYAYMTAFGVKSMMAVPLVAEDQIWGFIVLDDCISNRTWTQSDIYLVRLIANVISGAIARDINAQKLTRMSAISSGSPQFINYITPDGRFVYCNQGTERVLGYAPGELEGGDISTILDAETLKRVSEDIIPAILKDGSMEFEIPLKRIDGTYRLMSFSSFTIDTTPIGIGSIALDITEKRRLEEDLIAAKEQAEASNHAKSDFLSRMSHEMRTPMGAIIGMTAIAKGSGDIAKKEYCLDRIEEASRHLLGVINDILDMSKIEADKLELSYTEFDLEKMLMRVVDVSNFRITEKNQNLIVRIDPALPASIHSDEQRLAQVITNFLSNATKFTPDEGTVTLEAKALGKAADGRLRLEISVTDTGIGISQEQQSRLFRSFEQADGGISRKFGGTGLGLAISKRIVELMDGEVWVESELGHGARFGFRIEVEPGKERAEGLLGGGINWNSLRALVVDDSRDVLEYFHSIADSIGLHLQSALSGSEAFGILKENEGSYFHIIFVDWHMPGMDGIELTRKIKEEYIEEPVVIMISAAEWSDIEPAAKRAGVDRFLPKPLFASTIVNCINECLGVTKREEEPDLAQNDTYPGRHILLAEDIEINREIVISVLEDTGVIIDVAENGEEACLLFAENPARYDVVFMDIHMPDVDGYEATRRIRAMDIPEAKTVPIVAMTANVFREDVERCLAAGMNDHIGKPIDMPELFSKLNKYMNYKRGE